MPRSPVSIPLVCSFLLVVACQVDPETRTKATLNIDDTALKTVEERVGDWLLHGRTHSEQRYSPLNQIDADNVGSLGLAWAFDTHTNRGLEATPIVVDGVLFTTGSWSVVFAIDARTGEQLWKWDPRVPASYGQRACCDVVNRGVAIYKGRVYVGVLDGRLVALDAETGSVVWETITVDQSLPYTITGAPRIVKGKVIIGNGGSEFGVRGYVSAFDAETGELVWRFYTVPGDPSLPFETEAMKRAAPTWKGGEWWKIGGGGTVWDSLAYDPELDLLYVGTGNGSPWNQQIRSPGGGDNLYLCSILALRPDSGELVWHYQTTPGDTWDYTSTQHMLLAELEIGGEERKVLLQAPKNGFFYVLDRATGELLSAEAFAEVTWATGVDMTTGRPIPVPGAHYRHQATVVQPSPFGAHNWQPMSYNPQTGLVYIPAQEVPFVFAHDPKFEYRPGTWNLGLDHSVVTGLPRELATGHLLAWDPVNQRERWRVQYDSPWNGGTLTTAGNLVFQGTADGHFVAYRADNGEKLWSTWAGTGIIAAPVTYQVDGKQYVSIMAGWGGAFALVGGDAAAANQVTSVGKLLTFTLDATEQLPPRTLPQLPRVTAIASSASPETVKQGSQLYARWCVVCHGAGAVGGGVISDLRYSTPQVFERYQEIVLEGMLSQLGMPSLEKWLDGDDITAIRSYVISRRAEIASAEAAPD